LVVDDAAVPQEDLRIVQMLREGRMGLGMMVLGIRKRMGMQLWQQSLIHFVLLFFFLFVVLCVSLLDTRLLRLLQLLVCMLKRLQKLQ
jgi:hypothetical protein